MEEFYIKTKGKTIRIYAFLNKKVPFKEILFKNKTISSDLNKEDKIYKTVTILDNINRKDRIFNLKNVLEKSDILLINSALKIGINQPNIETVSYGMDEKASLTLSSIDDIKNGNPVICIQRGINSVFSKKTEPMELKFGSMESIKDINTYAGISALKIVLELD